MNVRKLFLLCACVCMAAMCCGQDRGYAVTKLNDLASPEMHGRGYVKRGSDKAASYIERELRKNSPIKPFGESFRQNYKFSINTFPKKINVRADGDKLSPGTDFIVHPACKSTNATFELVFLPDDMTDIEDVYMHVDTSRLENKMVVFPVKFENHYMRGVKGIRNAAFVSEKMFWHCSNTQRDICYLKIREGVIDGETKTLKVNFKSKLVDDYEVSNVIGHVDAKHADSDSLIVISAHYDHLGMMGPETFFPGASDNASGTSMLLDLARHFSNSEETGRHKVVFMFLSGEEAGLQGSTFCSENPIFDLEKVSLLINIDMVGTGSEGITVVNGKVFPDMTDKMMKINEEQNLNIDIALRGEACNSDHCPFYQKGVKSVFIYTRGPEDLEYHTTTDTADKLPFTIYENLFKLITTLINTY